jgi:hypothetical protein
MLPMNAIKMYCASVDPNKFVVRTYNPATHASEPPSGQLILYDGSPCESKEVSEKISELVSAMIENTGIIPQIAVDKTYYNWDYNQTYYMHQLPSFTYESKDINYTDNSHLGFPTNPKKYPQIAIKNIKGDWTIYDYKWNTKCSVLNPYFPSNLISPDSTENQINLTQQISISTAVCNTLDPNNINTMQTLKPDKMSQEWNNYQQIKLDINALISVLVDQVCIAGKINANRMLAIMRSISDRYCKPDSQFAQTYFSKLFDLFIGPLSSDILSQKGKPITTYANKSEVFILQATAENKAAATTIAQQRGFRLATFAELLDAHANGAHWCAWGWISDKTNVYMPLQEDQDGCGEVGLRNASPVVGSLYAPICYGVKPQTGVLPFNEARGMYYQQSTKPYVSPNQSGEVFQIGSGYDYTKTEAPLMCEAYGAKVATKAQLDMAQLYGAEWCSTGWLTDGTAGYPMQSTRDGCGTKGVNINTPPDGKASVNCFGIKPPSGARPFTFKGPYYQQKVPKPEVFHIGGYNNLKSQAEAVCNTYGAKVATKQQLYDAQALGAEWCSTGWVADDPNAIYPMQSQKTGCGTIGINQNTPPDNKAGVNCYGIKPASGPMPWNSENYYYNMLASKDLSMVAQTGGPLIITA